MPVPVIRLRLPKHTAQHSALSADAAAAHLSGSERHSVSLVKDGHACVCLSTFHDALTGADNAGVKLHRNTAI